jgi:hypothetical protein
VLLRTRQYVSSFERADHGERRQEDWQIEPGKMTGNHYLPTMVCYTPHLICCSSLHMLLGNVCFFKIILLLVLLRSCQILTES